MSKYRIVQVRQFFVIEYRWLYLFWIRENNYQLFSTVSDAEKVILNNLNPNGQNRVVKEYC